MKVRTVEERHAYYMAHREENLAYGRAYRATHRDEIRARQKPYDAGQRATHNARVKRAYADSPELRCHLAHYFATRKFGLAVDYDAWEAAWFGSCFDCGKTPAEGVDHIIPFCHDGQNEPGNLQPACRQCNHRKGTKERRLVRA